MTAAPLDGNWVFTSSVKRYFGVLCTKMPSPWLGSYGDFRISSAVSGDGSTFPDYSAYDSAHGAFSPYYHNATLLSYGGRTGFATVEVTAPPLDEFAWKDGYTEAGPWQYRVEVPYDPHALQDALTAIGADGCAIVQEANTIAPAAHCGGYCPAIIHEMTEMQVNMGSQWELNNQPVWALQHMQVGFDTRVSGRCASQAQRWLRGSTDFFHGGASMFPGDEDNGSMGAWYLLNALGLYPLSPASGKYVLGSPLFAQVSLTLGGEAEQPPRTLVVKATGQHPDHVYVRAVSWNGAAVQGVEVDYAALMAGGTLEFSMAAS